MAMISASVKLNHPPYRNQWIDESPINVWLLTNVGVHARFRDQVDEDRPWHVDHERDFLMYHFARETDAVMFGLKWL
jgi:hypothetical protein